MAHWHVAFLMGCFSVTRVDMCSLGEEKKNDNPLVAMTLLDSGID